MEPLMRRPDSGDPAPDRRGPLTRAAMVAGVLVVGLIALGIARTRADGGDGVPRLSVRSAVVSEGGDEAAGYLAIQNEGGTDQLLAVDADEAGTVSIHRYITHGGAQVMERQPGLRIPPDATTHLQPGGTHLMLEDLRKPLHPGDQVTLTLSFSRSGPITVRASVASYTEIASSVGEEQGP